MRNRNVNFHALLGSNDWHKGGRDEEEEVVRRKTHDKFHNCITSATSKGTTFIPAHPVQCRISYSHILHFLLPLATSRCQKYVLARLALGEKGQKM